MIFHTHHNIIMYIYIYIYIYIYTLSCIITFFSTEINKRTYVVSTYPHQSHHVLINRSVHASQQVAMPIHLGTDPRNHV